jgi:hypothetical protein
MGLASLIIILEQGRQPSGVGGIYDFPSTWQVLEYPDRKTNILYNGMDFEDHQL